MGDVGLGMDLVGGRNTALRIIYKGQFGELTTQHSGTAKFNMKF